MKAKELFGKEVLGVHGNSIGKVSDIELDILHGNIEHIVVKSGLTRKHHITVDEIVTIGDKIILKTSKGDLEKRSSSVSTK